MHYSVFLWSKKETSGNINNQGEVYQKGFQNVTTWNSQ